MWNPSCMCSILFPDPFCGRVAGNSDRAGRTGTDFLSSADLCAYHSDCRNNGNGGGKETGKDRGRMFAAGSDWLPAAEEQKLFRQDRKRKGAVETGKETNHEREKEDRGCDGFSCIRAFDISVSGNSFFQSGSKRIYIQFHGSGSGCTK